MCFLDEDESTLGVEHRLSALGLDLDTNILLDEDEGFYDGLYSREHRGNSRANKLGQCPYLVPLDGMRRGSECEDECNSDENCPSSSKCCLNSCGGRQCTEPLFMTGMNDEGD